MKSQHVKEVEQKLNRMLNPCARCHQQGLRLRQIARDNISVTPVHWRVGTPPSQNSAQSGPQTSPAKKRRA